MSFSIRVGGVAGIVVVLSLGACARATADDRANWAADFEQLADHMAAVYANLEWVVQERGIDVHALSERARGKLAQASSRRAARKTIEGFVEAFGDPHFYVKSGDGRHHGAGATPDPGLAPDTSTDDALDAMNFRSRNLDFRIDFEKLPGYRRIRPSPENPFAWAEFQVGARRVGLVRIAHFGEDGYPKIAQKLWPAYADELDAPCDIYCQWRFREHVRDALLGHLADGARKLHNSGVDAVLIDISGNGGGTDWAAVAPRIFAPPLTKCPPTGVARHPHHASRLERRVEHVQSLIDDSQISDESRQLLERARDAVSQLHQKTNQPCDRRPLFHEENVQLECSQLAFAPGCGIFEYLPPGSLPDVEQRASVFRPLGSSFEEAIWQGPLFVVVDGSTASASEHFVALLEANDTATFLGQPTLGAGCGFIGGGVPAYLPHLDVTVWMPDCARYRANGKNEIEGIEPDVPLDWSGGDKARARRIHTALTRLLEDS